MMGLKALTQPACDCFGRFMILLKRGKTRRQMYGQSFREIEYNGRE